MRINGETRYLGVHGSPASHRRYREIVRAWEKARDAGTRFRAKPGCTIAELVASWWGYAKIKYRQPDGTPTEEQRAFRDSLQPLLSRYGKSAVEDFGPDELRQVREDMIGRGWSRRTINQRVGRIRRVFKWGVGNGNLVPGAVLLALQAVEDLDEAMFGAPDPDPVAPVPWEHVEATLPHLSPPVRALVLVQWWSGCRPGEACSMRTCDVIREGTVRIGRRTLVVRPGTWLYVLGLDRIHKGRRRQKVQVYVLGPRAQEAIAPFLRSDDPEAHLFSPAESMAWHTARKREQRQTKVQPSQKNRAKRNPKKKPGTVFGNRSYCHAIEYAIAAAARVGTEIPHWHPHQLRHACECRLESDPAVGIEGARVYLGHEHVDTTKLYGQRDFEKASDIAQRLG